MDNVVTAASLTTQITDSVASGVGARALVSNHAFVQATGVNQAGLPAAEALCAGKPALTFTGSQYYDSTLTAAQWTFLHNGSGMAVYIVYVPTNNNQIVSTIDGSAAPGVSVASNAIGIYSTFSTSVQVLLSGATFSAATYLVAKHANADTPQGALYRRGVLAQSGPNSVAPLGTAPAATLRIGAYANGTAGYAGTLCEVLIAANTNLALDAKVRRYIFLQYGLA